MLNKDIYRSYIGMMFEMYDRNPTKALMDGYYMVLQDMSDTDFTASIKNILSSRVYSSLPKPAEILEYSRPDLESIATLAWDDVRRAISIAGAYSSPTFQDIVVNSVVQALGGWIFLCNMNESELVFAKKEFIKIYPTYSKKETHPERLIGIAERSNGYVNEIPIVKAGYELPKVNIVPSLNAPKSMQLISNLVKEKQWN